MIKKWAMCICTGIFAHIDHEVFRASVQELAPSSALLTHLSAGVEGWGKQWVAEAGLLFQR